ncbi:M48 family metallopeptidase, partial [Polaribacter sp.]|uniref:M48 family metallopeptidase n=1 Tax=Polaribacter sp. TaxID=1920175 RepID=UPI003F69A370
MQPTTVFYILIAIIIISFLTDKILDVLNTKHFNDKIPTELEDVYDEEAYKKSQAYKKENSKFSNITSTFSILLTLGFFFADGFKYVDNFARSISENPIIIALIFFGIIMIGSDILNTPFSYYKTFVIEEKFGFNKSTKKTFWLDKIKGIFLMAILGGGILALIIWFYQKTGVNFWVYAWVLVAVFSLFMNLFYAKLIVPIFNKQTPLEDGELKFEIEKYAQKVGFKLDNIFVIDGSKRST